MPNIEPGAWLYIVMGETGEYSDHTEWPILAYVDETKAQTHVELAQQRASEILQHRGALGQQYNAEYDRRRALGELDYRSPDPEQDTSPSNINEYDPHMRIDYTGVRYRIEQVRLAPEPSIEPTVTEPGDDLWTVLRADDA